MSDDPRKEIRISPSLVNKMFPDGNEIKFCSRRLYMENIEKVYRTKDTEAQAAGKFFEYICLGAGADMSNLVTDFRDIKKGRGGEKSIDQVRIEDQARVFEEIYPTFGVNLDRTQERIEKEWDHTNNVWADQYRIMVTGITDFMSPIMTSNAFTQNDERTIINEKMAVHDLKLTKDIYGGPHTSRSWANPWTMSQNQGIMYHIITGFPVFFWVFDYKSRPEFRIYQKEINAINLAETHEAIRKTAEMYVELHEAGWPSYPAYHRCKSCELTNAHCDQRTNNPDIQIY